MKFIPNIIFVALLMTTGIIFCLKVSKIRRNILLGKEEDRSDRRSDRFNKMFRVAIGQSKMTKKPLSGFLHIIVYVGFVLINIEILEIVVDGVLGTHRVFAGFLGVAYNILIGVFEYLAFGVLLACVVFLIRRLSKRIKRFDGVEMTAWPKSDANIILIAEIALMSAFLIMNGADFRLQSIPGHVEYIKAGYYPLSGMLFPIMGMFEVSTLVIIERSCWWFHILGIFGFLLYLPFSKHFHIILAFPNVFYSKLDANGRLSNMSSVREQVNMMMDPNIDPYAAPDPNAPIPEAFGAKDVTDLSWKSIMDGYTCTECGRCTDQCPANQTGKLLSPRKIIMDVRDRIEEVGSGIDKNGKQVNDGKSLLYDFITPEELWACTSCNACTESCPVNNDPLAVIVELRRFLVMEKSEAPSELNVVFGNIENNGAPWAFSASDRINWRFEED